MKYYATESSLNVEKREKLEAEMAEFLERGGTITSIDKSGNFLKKEVVAGKSGLTGKAKTNVKKMTENNKIAKQKKEERLKVQRPIFELYNQSVTLSDKWTYLSKAIGGVSKPHQLKKVAHGLSSILEEKVFQLIEQKITEIILEHEKYKDANREKIEELKRKGFSCDDKISRVIKQQPILLDFQERYTGERSCWAVLSEELKGRVSAKQLRCTAKAETSVSKLFHEVEKAINKILGEQNEEKKAS